MRAGFPSIDLLATCAIALGLLHLIPAPASAQIRDAFEANRLLSRGINLGNALEAPNEGDWGMRLEDSFFEAIHQAGFQSVRIPIRWSAHALKEPPYTIDPAFAKRVDWAIDQALSQGLVTVINIHHYEEMDRDPDAERPRLLALWKQIAERYKDLPERLLFELLNEPHGRLDDARWNRIVLEILATIRASNPARILIVGPASWNSLDHLNQLRLPEDDRRIIGTFHYYKPMEFTHQGASWVRGAERWLGTKWTGSTEQTKALESDFEKAAAWSRSHDRPLFLGEFGAFSRADIDSRVRWTAAVAREAESRGFSWAYWEFGAGFGAYDRDTRAWRTPLLRSLIPHAE